MANIELDGGNKKITVDSGDLTLDIPGDIILDADGANVTFKDGGTSILDISNSSSDAVITSSVQDKDIIFKGDDGGSAITALTLDMSAAGAATFNGAVTTGGILKTDDTTEATSTTDGSLQTDGGLSVAKDTVMGDDLKLLSDAAVVSFGANSEITLTHVHDTGLLLQDSGGTPTLQLHDANESIASDGSKVIITSGGTAFSLPTSDGSNGQVIQTNGSGVLSFGAAGGFTVSDITGATALATQPASTDEIVLSDAGTLKRLDIKHIQNTPAFAVYKKADQAISDGTYTKVAFNTEVYDTDSTYDNSTNYRFTPAVAGKYFLTSSIGGRQSDSNTKFHNLIVSFYKNGSQVSSSASFTQASDFFSVTHTDTIDLDGDDYVEVYAFAQVQTETPVLESDTVPDGSRALGRALTFSGFRITGV